MKRIAKKHATGLWQVAAELQVIEVELTLTAADDFEKGRTHSRDQIDPSCSDAVMTLPLTFSQKMEDARSILDQNVSDAMITLLHSMRLSRCPQTAPHHHESRHDERKNKKDAFEDLTVSKQLP